MNRSSVGLVPSFITPAGAAPLVKPAGAAPVVGTMSGPSFERIARTIPSDNILESLAAAPTETLVLSTTTPRRGIDVFVQAPTLLNGYLHVKIYAVVGGVRALVGGGFLVRGNQTGERIAAARTWAERFEVTYVAVGTPTSDMPLTIAAIAGDNLPELPEDFGVTPMTYLRRSTGAITTSTSARDLSIVGADVVNTTAGALYLLAYNDNAIGPGQPSEYLTLVPANSAVQWRIPEGRIARCNAGVTFAASIAPDGYDPTGLVGGELRYLPFVRG